MKKTNKKKIILIFVVIVFLIIVVFFYSSVNGDFEIGNIYYNVEDRDITDKDLFVQTLTDSYNMSGEEAEYFYDTDDYMKITIGYTINNQSPLPMYISNPVFCNKSYIFVCNDKPESQSLCFLSAGENTQLRTDLILRKSEFTQEIFENLKIYIFTIGVSPLVKLNLSTSSATLSELVELSEPDPILPELFEHKQNYYLPKGNDNPELTLNDFNHNSVNITRFYSKGSYVYSIDKFEYNENHYCGVAFFDENGMFERGMVIHKLLKNTDKFDFKVGKTTLDDVKKVDLGCITFKLTDGTTKTYHYFDDKSCIEITYIDNVITTIENFSVEDMFSCITDEDLEYIYQTG